MNLISFTYSIAPTAPSADDATAAAMCVTELLPWDGPFDPLEVRERIMALQDHMVATIPKEEQTDCPLTHRFAPGVYAREIFVPAGTLIVGKIHRHAHLNMVLKGRASVMTEFGPMAVEAPHTFVSQPGTKRVVLAITDLIWTTIHANPDDETDLDAIEDFVIAKDYETLGLEGVPAAVLQNNVARAALEDGGKA